MVPAGSRARRRPAPDAQLLAATAATRLGEFPLAESLAGQALVKFRARGDADGRMRALNLLGVIRFERGRLGEAESLARRGARPRHPAR